MSDLGEHKGDGIRYAMHLSAPKGGSAQMLRDPSGNWVSWEDYKKVEDSLRHYIEQEALRKVGEALHQRNIDSGAYNREKNEVIARLKAENDRLRKAGDWMCGLLRFDFVTKEWKAAKEGKPQS